MAKCHACGKSIKEAEAYARFSIGGVPYLFCCPMCMTALEAGNLQRRIIPSSFSDEQVRVRVEYLPALQVGGDYACIRRRGDKMHAVVADISGHGITASLAVSRLSVEIERLIDTAKDEAELAIVLSRLMRSPVWPEGMYLTLFACTIDFSEQSIAYVNCGHPSQLLWSSAAQEWIRLESDSPPPGLFDSEAFDAVRTKTINLEPGGKLFLYTDGLLDLRAEDGIELGEVGVARLFQEMAFSPTAQAEDRLVDRVKALSDLDRQDDVLVIVIDVREGGQEPIAPMPS